MYLGLVFLLPLLSLLLILGWLAIYFDPRSLAIQEYSFVPDPAIEMAICLKKDE